MSMWIIERLGRRGDPTVKGYRAKRGDEPAGPGRRLRRSVWAGMCASGLMLIAASCASTRQTSYNGVGTTTPFRFTAATLSWVLSGSRATGTLTVRPSAHHLPDLPPGSYALDASVSGAVPDESFRGMLTMGRKTWAVAGATQASQSAIVLNISVPGGNVTVYLYAVVPGRYSGSVSAPSIDSMLSWERTGATATGHLTIGSHPTGTFPLPAGSYGTTFQFTGDLFAGTVHDGSHSLHAYGSVEPEDVVLTVDFPGGPMTLSFRSVGSQSYTGYGG
jgi:hypothetical protein